MNHNSRTQVQLKGLVPDQSFGDTYKEKLVSLGANVGN